MRTFLPQDYHPILNLRETEKAIKKVKDFFENSLSEALNLQRVSAPLFLPNNSGLNDNLNGVEQPVSFKIDAIPDLTQEIVHSLAKWKRLALERYKFSAGEGLYTDMNAIRTFEDLDNLHSVYVDQWDWEKIIPVEQRTIDYLQQTVRQIYSAFKQTEIFVCQTYPAIQPILPEKIHFVTTQELEDRYPQLDSKAREDAICKEYGAVFIQQIGGLLNSGQKHDGRAPDYDDWELNGDIVFWYPLLNCGLELSSMGIRVNAESLEKQCQQEGCSERLTLPFHQQLLNGQLPQTMGGGIGQSRICLFFLRKAHIGEVQSAQWPSNIHNTCQEHGIPLL